MNISIIQGSPFIGYKEKYKKMQLTKSYITDESGKIQDVIVVMQIIKKLKNSFWMKLSVRRWKKLLMKKELI